MEQPWRPRGIWEHPIPSPSQSLARKPNCPEAQYCLEIQMVSTEDERAAPPPSHAWQAPIMEDIVWDGKAGLMEAVITTPGWAILFYRQQSLGEGLSLGKVQTLCLCCWALLLGSANQPNSVPNQQTWMMVDGWSPKPSLKGTLNQEGLAILIQYHLPQHYSTFVTKICLYGLQRPQ